MLKFPIPEEGKTIHGEQPAAREMFAVEEETPVSKAPSLKDVDKSVKEILWAYRTTSRSSTAGTPFFLVYRAEALIPVEVGEPSLSFQYAIDKSNDEAIAIKLDLTDELRETVLDRLTAQKQHMGIYCNRRMNLRYFQVGDLVLRKLLVLRKVKLHTKNPSDGKLGSNWEVPYRVTGITDKGLYQLESEDGQ
ncbi:uncharacterized protein LOC132034600 [Lycium ferocissimum]|uniref:uncharacterized protein LOC132034600 n=1 Tax=Lycium ferocissimum TaxID=112874 RepID=UPI00281677C5|nr:uncharacterized protein LOC132034600 [Lycium ferocissimum]